MSNLCRSGDLIQGISVSILPCYNAVVTCVILTGPWFPSFETWNRSNAFGEPVSLLGKWSISISPFDRLAKRAMFDPLHFFPPFVRHGKFLAAP